MSTQKPRIAIDSLVYKHLSDGIWSKYCGVKTELTGFTLGRAITCAETMGHYYGLYAGDEECYTAFLELFEPYVIELHNLDSRFVHRTDMDSNKVQPKLLKRVTTSDTTKEFFDPDMTIDSIR